MVHFQSNCDGVRLCRELVTDTYTHDFSKDLVLTKSSGESDKSCLGNASNDSYRGSPEVLRNEVNSDSINCFKESDSMKCFKDSNSGKCLKDSEARVSRGISVKDLVQALESKTSNNSMEIVQKTTNYSQKVSAQYYDRDILSANRKCKVSRGFNPFNVEWTLPPTVLGRLMSSVVVEGFKIENMFSKNVCQLKC